jgi:hypothetical protein
MVESPKIKIKIQSMQFGLKMVVLECSFVKHSQGILGDTTCESTSSVHHPYQ